MALKLKIMTRKEALKEYKEMVSRGEIYDNPLNWHNFKKEKVSIQDRLEYFGYTFSDERNKDGYKELLTPKGESIGFLNISNIIEIIELEELRHGFKVNKDSDRPFFDVA